MTDNRTTELLCKLLEERGVEWKDGDASYEIEWSTPDGRHCSAMYWKPTFSVLISGCTPEQAIAATLGETYTREDVESAFVSGYSLGTLPVGSGPQWDENRQTVDEHMAELGWVRERTCRWELEHSGTLYDKWRCSKCGYLFVESRVDQGIKDDFDPNFCPNCGAKVVGE